MFLLTALLAVVPQGDAGGVGRVRDLAGRPVADAEVVLLSRPIAREFDAALELRHVVRTDAGGLYRVDMVSDARYSLWAHWADGASDVVEGVTAGEFVELEGVPGTGSQRLTLVGADAWPEAASFRLRALVGSENIDFVPLLLHEGVWTLPPLPPMSRRMIEVIDARGEVLWADSPRVVEDGLQLSLPPPIEHEVRVADAAGKPIAGVAITRHVGNYWYADSEALIFVDRFRPLWPTVGVTDAEGRLRVRVPADSRGHDLWLCASKDGYAMSLDGILNGEYFRSGQVVDPAPPHGAPILIQLLPHEPLTVPLRLGAKTPLGQQKLFLECRVWVKGAKTGRGTVMQVAVPVVEGRARLRPLPVGTEVRSAYTVLPTDLRELLTARHGVAPPRQLDLLDAKSLLEEVPPPQFDVDALRVVQVIAADGRPAARAVVVVGTDSGPATFYRTTRRGRALVSVAGATRVGVLGAGGIAGAKIEVAEKGPMQLQLEALIAAKGRVLDAQGQPVAGVAVWVARVAECEAHWAVSFAATQLLPLRKAVYSDADGNFQLSLPPFACALSFRASRTLVDRDQRPWNPAASAVLELVVR